MCDSILIINLCQNLHSWRSHPPCFIRYWHDVRSQKAHLIDGRYFSKPCSSGLKAVKCSFIWCLNKRQVGWKIVCKEHNDYSQVKDDLSAHTRKAVKARWEWSDLMWCSEGLALDPTRTDLCKWQSWRVSWSTQKPCQMGIGKWHLCRGCKFHYQTAPASHSIPVLLELMLEVCNLYEVKKISCQCWSCPTSSPRSGGFLRPKRLQYEQSPPSCKEIGTEFLL